MTAKTRKPPDIPPGCNVLLRPAQVAAALAMSVRQLQRLIAAGEFPRHESPEGRDPRWRMSTVNTWIDTHYGGEK